MLTALLISISLASAEMPLPAYDDAVARAKWEQLNAEIDDNCRPDAKQNAVVCTDLPALERVITETESFQKHVLRDAGLEYLIGYARRLQGDDGAARVKYEAAIALDPEYISPWYDLGELHLKAAEYDEADRAFAEISRLLVKGDRSWLGPWRQAEIAAHRHDPVTFERHMKEALARGFSFREIAGLPNWKIFYADPIMRDAIEKLITVYAPRDVLESLQSHSPPPE